MCLNPHNLKYGRSTKSLHVHLKRKELKNHLISINYINISVYVIKHNHTFLLNKLVFFLSPYFQFSSSQYYMSVVCEGAWKLPHADILKYGRHFFTIHHP